MTGEVPIASLDSYNGAMRRSLIDKMFFMDKVDTDVFIDIGCADGSLVNWLGFLYPDKRFMGFDIEPRMIDKARKEAKTENVEFFINKTALVEAISAFRAEGKTICIIMSSMIHEVYSYGPANIESFWEFIWGLKAEFVAIRDMMVSETASRAAPPLAVARIRQKFAQEVENGDTKIRQWEAQWGSLSENWSLIHFLLTYPWQTNWDREYRENYLPISVERFLTIVPTIYQPHYVNHYVLPYVAERVWKDFYLQLQDPTHVQLIFRRNKHGGREIQTT